jgi:ribosomal protein L11 methylase PrmA
MKDYAACLEKGKLLLMSGFYDSDRPAIDNEAQALNLQMIRFDEMNHWVATLYQKQ